jgi:Uma2 family endonuclease
MSASAHRRIPFMDVADFLEWEGADQPYELVEGEPRAMAPPGKRHRLIQTRLATLLTRHLDETGSACRAMFEPGVVPRVRAKVNLRIPDLGVTCEPDDDQSIMSEPVLLIEVLSPGNASDTRANVWTYITIPSVREVLIVHTARVKAELLRRRDDGSWPEQAEEIGPGGTVTLESIGLVIPIAGIYVRTRLAAGQPG